MPLQTLNETISGLGNLAKNVSSIAFDPKTGLLSTYYDFKERRSVSSNNNANNMAGGNGLPVAGGFSFGGSNTVIIGASIVAVGVVAAIIIKKL